MKRTDPDRTASAGLAQMWVMFGVQKGLDEEEICNASGFRSADIADRDRQIPWTWYANLRRTVIDRLPGVMVGVELAAFSSPRCLGYLGLAMRHCPNSLELLKLTVRFARAIDSAAALCAPRLELEADAVHWIIPTSDDDPPEAAEAVVIGGLTMLRRFTASHIQPLLVTFSAEREALADTLRELLGAPLVFGADETRIVFDRKELERPLLHANETAAKGCEAQLDKLMARLNEPFVAVVSRVIEGQLSDGAVLQHHTARRLGLSTRSLQRKLREHGVTHRRLVEDIRRERALRVLADEKRTIDEVAAAAGYEDARSLHRAFNRWTGKSPRAHRRSGGLPSSSRGRG